MTASARQVNKKTKPVVVPQPAAEVVVEQTPQNPEPKMQPPTKRRFPAVLAGGVALVLVGIIVIIGYEAMHRDTVFAGVTLNGKALSGKTYDEVTTVLTDYEQSLRAQGLTFTYNNETLTVAAVPQTTSSDGTTTDNSNPAPIIDIAVDTTAQTIFSYGRNQGLLQNLTQQFKALTTGYDVTIDYTLDHEAISAQLEGKFSSYTTPYQNAVLVFAEDHSTTITPEQVGTTFNWSQVISTVEQAIEQQQPVNITLALQPESAPVTTAVVEQYQADAKAIAALAPLSLTYESDTYSVDQTTLESWLTIEPTGVTLLSDQVNAHLATVAGEIDVPVQEGRFSLNIVNDEVQLQQFKDGQDGLGVNKEKTLAAITDSVLQQRQSAIPLVVEVTHPRANPENLNDLGIKELLGTGETNFAGSPSNRRYNIAKGAELLNGLLIAPGEEFSLLSILSPVDLAHGWLSELVIKGDKLEKEAGGGLCQVGSTAFRAAMLAGLDITERRNHSWAVSYYNYKGKAGVDATIYEPSPDFKFVNTTDHYILWRSRIEGSDIYFELWGTSDGRKGYFTDPVNYNIVSPGPTEEVVDNSLAPGTRNCVQHAYTGVSASFDYIIERADGTKDVETFTSTYRARPERCVVGPEAEETEETTEETTPDTTDETTEDPTDDTNTNTNDSNTNNSNTNRDTNTNKNENKNTNKNTNKKNTNKT